MLTGSALLSAVGLFALSFAYDFKTAFAAATIYGLGIVYFWPTMLGVTAERFPRGGAFLLGLMGCIGNLSVGIAQPWMGRVNDQITFAAIPVRDPAEDPCGQGGPGEGRKGHRRRTRSRHSPPRSKWSSLDAQKEGAKWSFRYVSALPVLLRPDLRRDRAVGSGTRRIQAGGLDRQGAGTRRAGLGLLVGARRLRGRSGVGSRSAS